MTTSRSHGEHPGRRARRRAAATLAALGGLAATLVAAPTVSAQTTTFYVPGGESVVLLETTSPCSPPGGVALGEVAPVEAGTLTLTPVGAGCRLTFNATAGFEGATTFIGIRTGVSSGTALPFTVVVVDPDDAFRQGTTTEILPVTACNLPAGTELTVTPSAAGTARFGANGCGLFFTASTTFLGPFGITVPGGASQTLYVVPRPAGFTQPTVRASGSFTPVNPPPPPGPCILLSNTAVQFGDITVGGPFKNGDVAPTVSGCADPNVDQSVLVQTSSASNGSATLAAGCAGTEPAACTPAAGEFAVALVNSTFVDDFVLRTAPTTWIASERGTFTPRPAALAAKLPASVDAAAVGTSFSFDVTFTAVTV